MNAAFTTDGRTTTQRALLSKSCGMSSGTFRTSSITVPAFSSRLVSSFALTSPRANADGAIKSAPIRTAFQLFIAGSPSLHLKSRSRTMARKKPPRRLRKSYPSIQIAKKRREKKNRENKEENLCNSCRRRRGFGKSEDCGDQGHDKKRQGPPQHFASSGQNLV